MGQESLPQKQWWCLSFGPREGIRAWHSGSILPRGQVELGPFPLPLLRQQIRALRCRVLAGSAPGAGAAVTGQDPRCQEETGHVAGGDLSALIPAGRKAGKGFYVYQEGVKNRSVNSGMDEILEKFKVPANPDV